MDNDSNASIGSDGRLAHAKETVKAKAEDLRHRFDDAKGRIDLEGRIRAHPLPALGIAFALGAAIRLVRGLAGGRASKKEVAAKSTIGGAIGGAISALAMKAARDYAISRLSGVAKTWYQGRQDDVGPNEQRASRDASVEAFLEH